ncbi:MAG: imidazole glycerol phosphate synthase cyclase subunit [Bacteroidota bacterium]|nr:imidazole glycerol phosphate synthase cyclase subunit [Bacteroidota bacterium]
MLKIRIIPTILWKDFGIVKGISFDSWRRVGSLLPAVKVYNTRQVDELVIMDISATEQNREPDFDVIDDIADECFVPLTVGGGVQSLEHIKKLLRAGADKVAINSAAYDNPSLITQGAEKFGRQCMVVSIDYARKENGDLYCVSQSGKKALDIHPVEWAKIVDELGAGEIILTSVHLDGTMKGYDLDCIQAVASAVNIPIIASGGAGDYEDLYLAITQGHASAVAAASMFHFTQQTPLEAKIYLRNKGIKTRI